MDAKNIVLLGVIGRLGALRRDTGAQLWATPLKSNGFVTVSADEERAYAHTGGELFCLELKTGNRVWHNPLPGLGYSVASLALPEATASADSVFEKYRQDAAAAQTTAGSSHSSSAH